MPPQRANVHRHTNAPIGTFRQVHIDPVGPLPTSRSCRYLLTVSPLGAQLSLFAASLPKPSRWHFDFIGPQYMMTLDSSPLMWTTIPVRRLCAFLSCRGLCKTATHPTAFLTTVECGTQKSPGNWVEMFPLGLLGIGLYRLLSSGNGLRECGAFCRGNLCPPPRLSLRKFHCQ